MAKQEEQLNLRIPRELKEWVKEKAKESDRSMNYTAVELIKQGRRIQEAQS